MTASMGVYSTKFARGDKDFRKNKEFGGKFLFLGDFLSILEKKGK